MFPFTKSHSSSHYFPYVIVCPEEAVAALFQQEVGGQLGNILFTVLDNVLFYRESTQ